MQKERQETQTLTISQYLKKRRLIESTYKNKRSSYGKELAYRLLTQVG